MTAGTDHRLRTTRFSTSDGQTLIKSCHLYRFQIACLPSLDSKMNTEHSTPNTCPAVALFAKADPTSNAVCQLIAFSPSRDKSLHYIVNSMNGHAGQGFTGCPTTRHPGQVLIKSCHYFMVSGVRFASGSQQKVQNSMLDVGCSMFFFSSRNHERTKPRKYALNISCFRDSFFFRLLSSVLSPLWF